MTTQIIDNPAATFTGEWIPYDGQGYGNNVHYIGKGSGSDKARWSVPGVVGKYKVYVTWSPYDNRATNAPFTVRDGDNVLQTVRVNQREAPPDGWLLLGEFEGNLSVELTNDADGFVIADAVRFESVDSLSPNPEPEPQPEPPPVPPSVSLGCPCSKGVSKMKAVSTLRYEGDKLVGHTLEVSCEGAAGPVPNPNPNPNPNPDPDPNPNPGSFELSPNLTTISIMPNSPWHQRVDDWPVHPRSAEIVAAAIPVVPNLPRLQNDFGPSADLGGGIPYSAGSGNPPVPITVDYPTESDPGPFPIPLGAPFEAGSDKHLIYLDRDTNKIHELMGGRVEGGGFKALCNAVWDITKPWDQRPVGWTSADAAGLPILPMLIRLDEMRRALAESDPDKQHLGHALRFTLSRTGHGFLPPARHFASTIPYSLPGRPPMGMRCRLKKSVDLSIFNPASAIIMRTLQLYGGILADNGANWFLSGTFDLGWDEFWDDLTGNINGKIGVKSFSGQRFLDNWEVLDFADTDVVTQV